MVERLYLNAQKIDFQKNDVVIPTIIAERVDGVNIGRIILPVTTLTRWEPNSTTLSLLNSLNGNSNNSETIRNSIRFSLNNNTTNERAAIAHKRAVSAYFTYNPNDETVIIEWGTINPNSEEAKLHNYLNRIINYRKRVDNGMKLSSGHLAKMQDIYVALFDNITQGVYIKNGSPMGKTINTLYHYGIIPLTTEGYLRLPTFQ